MADAQTDRVKFTEKTVEAYSLEDLKRLFAAANQEEFELFQFLLGTGVREQEAMFTVWKDVDFNGKSFKVSEKLDLGFTPKDKEEGSIPIPDSLVALLKARRERYPADFQAEPRIIRRDESKRTPRTTVRVIGTSRPARAAMPPTEFSDNSLWRKQYLVVGPQTRHYCSDLFCSAIG
jgi:integrase